MSRPRKDLWHVGHVDSSDSRPLLSLDPFFPRLPAFFNRPQLPRQSPHFFPRSPAFFRSLPTTERVPPFFPRSPAFFRSLPTTERVSPFFLARPLYRESPQLFFPRSPAFFVRPQLPRESPPLAPPPPTTDPPLFFPRSPAFFVRPNYRESSSLFSSLSRLFRSPQLPRAWNRLSENLQRSCLFSTQCLRIAKSVLLEFDRDQYYVLPK